MKLVTLLFGIALVLLLCVPPATGMAGNHPRGQKIAQQPDWPVLHGPGHRDLRAHHDHGPAAHRGRDDRLHPRSQCASPRAPRLRGPAGDRPEAGDKSVSLLIKATTAGPCAHDNHMMGHFLNVYSKEADDLNVRPCLYIVTSKAK